VRRHVSWRFPSLPVALPCGGWNAMRRLRRNGPAQAGAGRSRLRACPASTSRPERCRGWDGPGAPRSRAVTAKCELRDGPRGGRRAEDSTVRENCRQLPRRPETVLLQITTRFRRHQSLVRRHNDSTDWLASQILLHHCSWVPLARQRLLRICELLVKGVKLAEKQNPNVVSRAVDKLKPVTTSVSCA